MGFFKRKKDEEVKIQLEREALDKLNSNDLEFFDIPAVSVEENPIQLNGKIRAPHTITAEELNSKAHKPNNNININVNNDTSSETITEEIPMSMSEENVNSPTDFLYQKMMQSRAKILENTIQPEKIEAPENDINDGEISYIPTEKSYTPLDLEAAIEDIKNSVNPTPEKQEKPETELVADNKDNDNTTPTNSLQNTDEESKASEQQASKVENDVVKFGGNAEERRATLLARCNAYLKDDTSTAKINTEKYKLESVESILEGFEARATERINKKFNSTSISSNTAQAGENKPAEQIKKASEPHSPTSIGDTVIFKAPNSATKTEDLNKATTHTPTQAKHIFTADDITKAKKPANDSFDDFSSTRIITDISSHSKPVETNSSNKTEVFPVVESVVDTNKSDNYASNINDNVDNQQQKLNFDDYTTVADRPKILSSLLRKKKAFTFKLLLSLLAFVVSLIFITPVSANIISSKTTLNILELIVCLFILFVNINTISSIKSLFNPKAKNALPAMLSLIAATLFSIINLIVRSDFVGFSSVTAISLISYNLANRNFYSKTIKNFNLIANAEFKNAVSIIQNKGATKTIVGNSIEGSSLVCYGGETTNIHDFLRYTFCKNPISDKIQKLSLIGIIIGFVVALSAFLLNTNDAILSLYIFCATICFTALPSAYHIVSLTINSANKRLNHYDAMITGYHAADELELCNAIAVNSDSLFPEGTVRLVDMKLLSPNPFDQSILDAAAIASTIHSPLAGIFKQMDASKAYGTATQEVDSVIYEEKMGISGWVNDRRVFVGNRDLLIAHGFVGLPPAELDKKIMRKGYFPVYIASDNIPCALLVVKYEPDQDIVYEMQRLANTGTTILVDNCDPNISAQMLADYFELYDETVFIMNKQGSDFYKALTQHKEHRRAGAAYKSRIEGLLASLTASINIKKYISRMTAFYICSIILGLLSIITCVFTSLSTLITPLNILIIQILLSSITLLPTILRKP
ncbi:MAG: hypothetical protein J6C29_03555 [Clostridia bacterium]|nr:hypothetical protein [Clostridia bacterium]